MEQFSIINIKQQLREFMLGISLLKKKKFLKMFGETRETLSDLITQFSISKNFWKAPHIYLIFIILWAASYAVENRFEILI